MHRLSDRSLRVLLLRSAWICLRQLAIPATLAHRAEDFDCDGFRTAAAAATADLSKYFARTEASGAIDVGPRRYQSGSVAHRTFSHSLTLGLYRAKTNTRRVCPINYDYSTPS